MLRVLIVEDEGLIAFDLARIVNQQIGAATMIVATVGDALRALGGGIDLCFLDVDVADGQTFELARLIKAQNIPFAFSSGTRQSSLPEDLRCEPFLSKPFSEAAIGKFLQESQLRDAAGASRSCGQH